MPALLLCLARSTHRARRSRLTLSALTPGKGFSFDGIAITPVVERVPSPQALAAERPQPWPARGATAPGATEVMAPAPRDRRGRVCLRSTDFTGALQDLKATWRADIARIDVPTVRRATRKGCMLLEEADKRSDGTVDRDKFWSQAWPVILDEAEQALRAAARADLKLVLLVEPPTPTAKLDTSPAGWVDLHARSDFVRGMREIALRLAPVAPSTSGPMTWSTSRTSSVETSATCRPRNGATWPPS